MTYYARYKTVFYLSAFGSMVLLNEVKWYNCIFYQLPRTKKYMDETKIKPSNTLLIKNP